MTASPLRVAIVGAGLMGRWHAHAARRAGARVVAIVDRNPGAAEPLATDRDATVYTSMSDALPSVDVVHLCTPTPTHLSLALEAVAAGRHVLVEKPFAADAADAARLLAAAEARGVLVCPVHQFVFQRGVQQAVAGCTAIGPLRHVELRVCSAGADGRDAAAPDRIAIEILPHLVAVLARLLPDRVAALTWMVTHPSRGEIRATSQAGDTTIAVLVSMSGRPTRNEMNLIGTAGTMHVDMFHGYAVTHGGRVSRTRKIVQPFAHAGAVTWAAGMNLARRARDGESAYPGLARLVRLFYRAVAGGGPSPLSAAEILAVAQTCERIESSLKPSRLLVPSFSRPAMLSGTETR